MKNTDRVSSGSGRIASIFIVISSILLVVLIFIFILIMKDYAPANRITGADRFEYYLRDKQYRDIHDYVNRNRAVEGKMDTDDAELSKYYAIADYFEYSISEKASLKAGDMSAAEKYGKKAEDAAGKMGDLNYAKDDIDKILEDF